jgi:hypothetical protein
MEILDVAINAFLTLFSLGLLIISIMTYKQHKKIKLLVITAVFIVFLIKSILTSLGLFTSDLTTFLSSSSFQLFDLVILVLLFFAVLKR